MATADLVPARHRRHGALDQSREVRRTPLCWFGTLSIPTSSRSPVEESAVMVAARSARRTVLSWTRRCTCPVGHRARGAVVQVHGIDADMDEGGMFRQLAERPDWRGVRGAALLLPWAWPQRRRPAGREDRGGDP